ncbi:hypothetical protein EZV62_003727 [Acer yangbiense]|uniref:Uncharacterized protein n=1 Tax=Acer yangbiense TaxID=1000413 RepID=A0A5C7IJF7_9ROSI|nr:hypothetical protein EZV62_003727 [Acer yangbiense]
MKRLQIEGAENAHTLKNKVCSCFLFPYSVLRRVVLGHSIAFKIRDINESLDAIAKEKDMYSFKTTTSIEQPQRVESTSFIDVSEDNSSGRMGEEDRIHNHNFTMMRQEDAGFQQVMALHAYALLPVVFTVTDIEQNV